MTHKKVLRANPLLAYFQALSTRPMSMYVRTCNYTFICLLYAKRTRCTFDIYPVSLIRSNGGHHTYGLWTTTEMNGVLIGPSLMKTSVVPRIQILSLRSDSQPCDFSCQTLAHISHTQPTYWKTGRTFECQLHVCTCMYEMNSAN